MARNSMVDVLKKYAVVREILENAERPMRASEIADTAREKDNELTRFWSYHGPVGVLCAMRNMGMVKRVEIGTQVVSIQLYNGDTLLKNVKIYGWEMA